MPDLEILRYTMQKLRVMNKLILRSSIIILILLFGCGIKDNNKAVLYSNGFVFNGKSFEQKDFIVKDGTFYFDKFIKVHEQEDLTGKYVIPPFGDAHTHNFDDLEQFDSIYNAYVDEGTFYVQVLTNHYSSYLKIKDSLNKPGKIDAAFAHGGITSTGGHPHALYETRSLGMGWRAMLLPENQEKIRNSRNEANDAYYLMDDVEDIEKHWSEIDFKEPSILKIYISDFEKRPSEIEAGNVGTYGLTKEVAKAVIDKAKKTNLIVYAHIETVDDFTWALNNGVTHFAHMPGYGGGYGKKDLTQYIIPNSTLQKASKAGVVITPTVSFAKYYAQAWNGKEMAVDSTLLKEKQEFLRNQLQRMHSAGINIALGADQNGSTLMEEVKDLMALNAFNNEKLLDIILGTPRHIFPNRKIGHIREGYEGSFLVLENNPLEEISSIFRIVKKVKNGKEI